jgi:hypothetical protein
MFFRKYKIFPQIKNAVVDGKRMKDRKKIAGKFLSK